MDCTDDVTIKDVIFVTLPHLLYQDVLGSADGLLAAVPTEGFNQEKKNVLCNDEYKGVLALV